MAIKPRRKKRSPDYPGISLKDALGRAHTVYEEHENHPMPPDAVLALWKYSPKSGPGLVQLAALKRFGLMVAQGRGEGSTVSLTDEAYAYFDDDREDQSDRIAFIEKAAFLPPIHREIFDKYGASPKVDVLRHYLKTERAFTSSGADGLISEYVETMAFAGCVEPDNLPEDGGDETPDTGAGGHEARKPPPHRPKEIPMPDLERKSADHSIPIGDGNFAILRAPAKITAQEYHFMTTYLEAMKDAIIVRSPQDAQEDEGN